MADGVVFVQDMESDVIALRLSTGRPLWERRFSATNEGPDGVAVAGGRVFGATDSQAFALSAATGKLLWTQRLVTPRERFLDIAPLASKGAVFVSTIGLIPNGRGTLYALDAGSGRVRWRFDTIKGRWRFPARAGGGGAWYPPSLVGGEVYWGTANPNPWGGTRHHPNGGDFPGPALFTDSLLVLDAATGALRWYDQVTPHDIRDYDFQNPPIIGAAGHTPLVFGSGKAGIVIAWNRTNRRRVWQARVGIHRNDLGPLPRHRVPVCPGLYGGVETPMAYAGGRLFVPVVDLCMSGSAYGYEPLDRVDVAGRGTGELVALDAATGKRAWARKLPQPAFGCATVSRGVVFAPTFDGSVYAFDTRDGRELWRGRMRAGVNACPAVAGRTLLVGAGVPRPGGVTELVAFGAR